MNNQSEYQNFINENYYKPNEVKDCPSLYRDYEIKQIVDNTFSKLFDDEYHYGNSNLYYFLKTLDLYKFSSILKEVLNKKKIENRFYSSVCDLDDQFGVDLYSYFYDGCVLSDDIKESYLRLFESNGWEGPIEEPTTL